MDAPADLRRVPRVRRDRERDRHRTLDRADAHPRGGVHRDAGQPQTPGAGQGEHPLVLPGVGRGARARVRRRGVSPPVHPGGRGRFEHRTDHAGHLRRACPHRRGAGRSAGTAQRPALPARDGPQRQLGSAGGDAGDAGHPHARAVPPDGCEAAGRLAQGHPGGAGPGTGRQIRRGEAPARTARRGRGGGVHRRPECGRARAVRAVLQPAGLGVQDHRRARDAVPHADHLRRGEASLGRDRRE